MGFVVNRSNKYAFKRSRRIEQELLALARAVIFVGIVIGITLLPHRKPIILEVRMLREVTRNIVNIHNHVVIGHNHSPFIVHI